MGLLAVAGPVAAAGATRAAAARADWVTIVAEDFEGAFPGAGWAVSGTFHWAPRPCRAHGGSYAAWAIGGSDIGGPDCGESYPNSLNSWMTYGPFDLSAFGAAELEFWYWNHSEAAQDYLRVFASADGTAWSNVLDASGDSGGWQPVIADLYWFLGDPSVWIRFAFDTSLQGMEPEGAYVDDIAVRGRPVLTANLRSVAAGDGWVRESSEASEMGGAFDALGACRAGDDGADRQYRSILDFNTAVLPDDAVVTAAGLEIKKSALVGDGWAATHGGLLADIRRGSFHRAPALEAVDFQAAATVAGFGYFASVPGKPWFRVALDSAALAEVNVTGRTQFRVRYAAGDDDDRAADYLAFYCGDALLARSRPVLRLAYFVP